MRGDETRWLHIQDEEIAGRSKLASVLRQMDGLKEQLEGLG